jgi:hypothetical protein
LADPGAELGAKELGGAESHIERLGEDVLACGMVGMLNDDDGGGGGKILRGRFKCFNEPERERVRGWSLSSSSQPGDPSSTSSSFASLITTTSVPSARLACSISIDSLSPIESIYGEK